MGIWDIKNFACFTRTQSSSPNKKILDETLVHSHDKRMHLFECYMILFSNDQVWLALHTIYHYGRSVWPDPMFFYLLHP